MSLQLWDDEAVLQHRLQLLGLKSVKRIALHENRTVMVSLARGRVLRMHRGYVYAPDRVLRAVVNFLKPRATRAQVRRAERELLAFPVEEYVPPQPGARRAQRLEPGDGTILRVLAELHRRFNREHFGGGLSEIRIRLSSRMHTRLGELTLEGRRHRPREIVISRRHIRRDGWREVEHTLLHEMVHQWQAERGLPVDHGPAFRQKAREVGVEPSAKRWVDLRPAARYE
ncbi:MAG: SprT-like domain-containing protein [Gemmatimonadetes bacterium]|nr:SprT-like domain-containing protein [Gemmatimonadota bacterium]